jgi:DNA-binding NarL/FixJ family response regulator
VSATQVELPRWHPPALDEELRTVELSPMLANILTSLCEGKDNKAIAAAWGITENTVKTHLKRLFRALAVGDRAQAVILASTGAVDVRIKPPAGRWLATADVVDTADGPVTVIGEWL